MPRDNIIADKDYALIAFADSARPALVDELPRDDQDYIRSIEDPTELKLMLRGLALQAALDALESAKGGNSVSWSLYHGAHGMAVIKSKKDVPIKVIENALTSLANRTGVGVKIMSNEIAKVSWAGVPDLRFVEETPGLITTGPQRMLRL